MPRFGAIAAFLAAAVMIAAVLILFTPTQRDFPLFTFVTPALALAVLAATKSLFNARGYRSADRIIFALIASGVLGIAYAIWAGAHVSFEFVRGAWGLVGLAVYALPFALMIPLGVHMLRFRALGGGIWKAPAVVYFLLGAGMLLLWAAVAIGTQGPWFARHWRGGGDVAALGLLLICLGGLVPAALIAHGFALLLGARRDRSFP